MRRLKRVQIVKRFLYYIKLGLTLTGQFFKTVSGKYFRILQRFDLNIAYIFNF